MNVIDGGDGVCRNANRDFPVSLLQINGMTTKHKLNPVLVRIQVSLSWPRTDSVSKSWKLLFDSFIAFWK